MSVTINGHPWSGVIDPRRSLADWLRLDLGLTGTKIGCNQGGCGACTVHVNGLRILSCLRLAVTTDGCSIVTIEGLAKETRLHPMQEAFVEHDALQCGFCTPGQIMSALGCIQEGATDDDAIRESMSGNLCRCAAYPGILEAIRSVAADPHRNGEQS